ncbi:hypothetical protein B0A52_06753 [Exophiala mesophila]|uniref:Uncharacterized protein n=1 Tax=Exophiala mesophila TaxID=212818 RepID=A0A438N014_EXOME|nr:hypothetical protein B0A52_06753 [Exophiala mesophila]
MPYSLKGRNVLVTGGSRGLGALIAQRFAAEGANVAINYISSAQDAENLAVTLKSDFGVETFTIRGDQGLERDCIVMVNETIVTLGGIDVVIANAGWTKFTNFGDLYSMKESEWDRCWAVNVKGCLHLCREAMKTFNKNPEGGVFLMTSSAGGSKFGEERLEALKNKAVLKKETDLEDCANAFVFAAKNSSLTGASIRVDSGYAIR